MQVSSPYSPDAHTAQARPFESQSWPRSNAVRQWYEVTQTTRIVRGPFFEESQAFEPITPQQQAYEQHQSKTHTGDHTQRLIAPHEAHRVSLDTAQSLPAAYHQADPHTPKTPTHIKGFFVGQAEKQQQHNASMALFGPDFVTNVMEYFYIREKPTSPQPEDGVIKTPGAGQGQFRDGFKVDMVGHGISEQKTIRDLPSREVISTQRRRVRGCVAAFGCAVHMLFAQILEHRVQQLERAQALMFRCRRLLLKHFSTCAVLQQQSDSNTTRKLRCFYAEFCFQQS